MIGVSVLIPSDDGDEYLLKTVEGRGWWLIHGRVDAGCAAKPAAQRIASEVWLLSQLRIFVFVGDYGFGPVLNHSLTDKC